ncbi:MAG TPA: hypothetical protein VN285_07430, partial [Candidatus Deferrimicrobium sp.]|nr:hypothetical protein [Candidatus Deferrimicrobium sp.]
MKWSAYVLRLSQKVVDRVSSGLLCIMSSPLARRCLEVTHSAIRSLATGELPVNRSRTFKLTAA